MLLERFWDKVASEKSLFKNDILIHIKDYTIFSTSGKNN